MIKPTRGRVVLFTPAKNDQLMSGDEPLAAIIAHVHSDTMLNLTVFDAFGRVHARPSVELVQEGVNTPPGTAFAEWMPYQKGQAAKAEQLEQKLAVGIPPSFNATQQPSQEPVKSQALALYAVSFQGALAALKDGRRVARAGWNGKGMFAYMVPAASYLAQTGAAKAHFGEGALVPYNAYFALKGVDDTVNTWVPSISDLLAEDWTVIE